MRNVRLSLAHWWQCGPRGCRGHFYWYKRGRFGATYVMTHLKETPNE